MRNNQCLHSRYLFCRLSIDIFLFIFNHFSFSWKVEEGIWKKAFTTKTTDHDHYMCQAQSVKLIALQHTFHLFQRKCISKSWRKTYLNQKTEFPDFSLTLTVSKTFADFSLTLKNFRFSLTFPWPWQPWYNVGLTWNTYRHFRPSAGKPPPRLASRPILARFLFQCPTYSMIRNKFYYKVKTLIPNITQLPINGLINEPMNYSN